MPLWNRIIRSGFIRPHQNFHAFYGHSQQPVVVHRYWCRSSTEHLSWKPKENKYIERVRERKKKQTGQKHDQTKKRKRRKATWTSTRNENKMRGKKSSVLPYNEIKNFQSIKDRSARRVSTGAGQNQLLLGGLPQQWDDFPQKTTQAPTWPVHHPWRTRTIVSPIIAWFTIKLMVSWSVSWYTPNYCWLLYLFTINQLEFTIFHLMIIDGELLDP